MKKIILLSLVLFIAACRPAPSAIRLEVPNLTLLPTKLTTWTALPSPPTSSPTLTQTYLPSVTNTFTPEITASQTITPTVTLTPTDTLIPPTFTPVPIPTDTQPPPTAAPICNCSRDYNCSDFTTHNKAQACFNSCGGSKTNNWSRLDGSDKDGKVCESLP